MESCDKKYIHKKLNGYKSQDEKVEIYSKHYFITADQVLEKLVACQYKCYYCNMDVKIEYTTRDMEQWTLDRIDNRMGHNTDNVLISCLGCNLKRRNRTVEKFLITKRLIIEKQN